MPKHTLFVCQSCHRSSEERPKDWAITCGQQATHTLREQPTDGSCLLKQLNDLHTEQPKSADFEIQPPGCLWTCDKPCAVAFSAPHKPTYLFTSLPTEQAAPALLQFGDRYLSGSTGDISGQQFPETLQSVGIAKIPVVER